MTITQLQTFLTVVERGSFSAAAADLVTSQSAVSHAVASLERELGVVLLDRGPGRPVALTELGGRVASDARELVRRAERIAEEASAYRGVETGRLRIASIASVAARLLPSLVTRFRSRHPRVEVAVLEGADPEVHAWLLEGLADVGFLAVPLDGLEAEAFVEDALMAVLPAGHPLSARSTLRPEDLAFEPFITSRSGCEPLIAAWFDRSPARIAYEVRAVETILGFVREGLGVTVLPELVHPDDATGLAIRPLDPPATRRVMLAWAVGTEPTPAAAAFLRDARSH